METRSFRAGCQTGTQVFSTGQSSAQRGWSKWPSHSVHFFGLITNTPPFSDMAAFGHSNSQMLQLVHLDPMIL
jgi:hypothetical protein